ncbi:MAG: BspA family leucine-rich repeat surface protein [Prevotella sp.]|nr:BspA family leucine-rich repeat surface protein [Prevotella sp.]
MEKNLFFKRISLFLIVVLMSMVTIQVHAQEQEPYAVLNKGTLTFYYDNLKLTRSGKTFHVPANSAVETKGWLDYKLSFWNVDFDPSFSDFTLINNTSNWFNNCSALVSISNLQYLNTANVTDMHNMFLGCSKLKDLDLSSLNTSQVTDMSYMFHKCSSLKTLNLSNFDTSQVTDMSYMFHKCSSLETLNLSNFDTSQVKDMENMFSGCHNLKSLDVSHFITSSVITMLSMFSQCYFLKSLDISNFNTSQVYRMDNMFEGCLRMKSLDLSNFDTQKVCDMNNMFKNCDSLETLKLGTLFKTGKVYSMGNMFYHCRALKNLDVSRFDTSNARHMEGMFYMCESLTSLDVSGFNTAKVENMEEMFYNCVNLQFLYLENFDTGNVTKMTSMFNNCKKLEYIFCDNTWMCDESQDMFTNCISLKNFSTSNTNDIDYANPETGYFTQSTFDLYISGTQVTGKNFRDVFGNGKVRFTPKTNTLTLDNATINTTEDGIQSGIIGLTINLVGNNSVTSTGNYRYGLVSESVTITSADGTGSLHLESAQSAAICIKTGITTDNTLYVHNCELTASGKTYGILGSNTSKMYVNGAVVKAQGYGNSNAQEASIGGFTNLRLDLVVEILPDNSVATISGVEPVPTVITTPANAAFNSTLKGVALNNQLVKSEVIISCKLSEYNLTVNGIKITSSNADDVLGDGTVSYNEISSILTLNNANLTNDGIDNEIDDRDLTINLIGSNTINNLSVDCNWNNHHTTVTSTSGGTLHLNNQLYAYSGVIFVVKDCKMTIGGSIDVDEGSTLIIDHAMLQLASPGRDNEVGVLSVETLVLDGSHISAPTGCTWDQSREKFMKDGQEWKGHLLILPEGEAYCGLTVCGVPVTNKNAFHLTEIDGVSVLSDDGEVRFEYTNNMLTLNNASIHYDGDDYTLINENEEDLIVKIVGTNSITGNGLLLNKTSTITSTGTLNIDSNTTGIFTNANLNIKGGVQLYVQGLQYGIQNGSEGSLTISGEQTHVEAECTENTAIGQFSGLTLEDGLEILDPIDASFVNNEGVVTGTTPAKKVVIGLRPSIPTEIKSISSPKVERNDQIYNLHGQKLSAPMKGIQIINGRKVIIN